jgi:hypothetical protein
MTVLATEPAGESPVRGDAKVPGELESNSLFSSNRSSKGAVRYPHWASVMVTMRWNRLTQERGASSRKGYESTLPKRCNNAGVSMIAAIA